MSNELLHHIETISREKGIATEKIIEALEEAMANAARRNFRSNENLKAFFNQETGEIDVFAYKTVVKKVEDPDIEISIEEAKGMLEEAGVGDELAIQKDTHDLGRIAAQTAKQIIFQKVREAERENIYEEYRDRIGDVVNGIIKRFEKGSAIVDIGRYEGILRKSEQSRAERYSQGERIRAVIIDVKRESRDPQIELSRTDPRLLKKLFEMEVPEIYDGTIIIKGAVREPGERAKISVMSKEMDIDPVGACVGMRGSRVQNIIRELRNERIDIIQYSEDQIRYVNNALSPARISKISISDEEEREMEVTVADDQLSLAIGRRGQNVRLASILTGWKLDIRSEGEKKKEAEEQMARLADGSLMMSDEMELVEVGYEEQEGEDEIRLSDLPGVGPKTVEKMNEAGIETVEQLASMSVEELIAVPGLGRKTAEKILSSLKE